MRVHRQIGVEVERTSDTASAGGKFNLDREGEGLVPGFHSPFVCGLSADPSPIFSHFWYYPGVGRS